MSRGIAVSPHKTKRKNKQTSGKRSLMRWLSTLVEVHFIKTGNAAQDVAIAIRVTTTGPRMEHD